MPPNKYAHGTDVEKPKYLVRPSSDPAAWSPALAPTERYIPGVHRQWWRFFGPPKQRLYPQCNLCSQKQSTAVRMNRRELVPHAHVFRWPTITGLIVGLAPYFHSH